LQSDAVSQCGFDFSFGLPPATVAPLRPVTVQYAVRVKECGMNEPQKWLVVRLSALGDVVLTTGVLDYLSRHRGWRFHVLTRRAWAPVFDGLPAVEGVAPMDDADLHMPRMAGVLRRLARQYEGWGLLDLHGTLRSRLLGSLWRGPVRRYPKMAVCRRLFLASGGRLCAAALEQFNVPQRYALAVEKKAPPRNALLPVIRLDEAETAAAGGLLPSAPDRPLVALHPYSTHSHKAWLDDNWRELAVGLVHSGLRCVVVGVGQSPFAGMQLPEAYFADCTGRTSLRQSCALLAAADVLVTGDSGPMHMACGTGTPVVALFGPTHRAWGFYPEGPRDVVLEADMACRPCSLHGSKPCAHGQRCMQSISVDHVRQGIRQVLNSAAL
jgi:ADP-heptose:LPS heptosyltransferase